MILKRYISTASIVCSLSLSLTGSALASTVSLDTTGPDSTQKVTIDNKSDVVVDNTNTVELTNINVQSASTGNVSADKNTSVGGATQSGDATNGNTAGTTVAVVNDTAAMMPIGGNGEGSVSASAGQPVGGAGAATPGKGGSVLGAAAVGGFGAGPATLPAVGATFPVDVSALRAAWQPQAVAPTAVLAKGSRWLTGAMLVTATVLGLLGAFGSAVYARRRQERV